MPGIPQVAVFDTAFHQTMPEKAYLYALPYEYYEKYKVRKYGFHGTSHRFVSQECAKLMGRPIEELKIVTCHLGNGASICAVRKGISVDTSMGFTPLDGLAMGTRSGSVDPAAVLYIMKKEKNQAFSVYQAFQATSVISRLPREKEMQEQHQLLTFSLTVLQRQSANM